MSISRLRSSQNNVYCLLKIFISKNSMQLFHGSPQHIFTACSYKKINKSCTCINNRIKLLLNFFFENLISNKKFRPLHDSLNMLIDSHDRQYSSAMFLSELSILIGVNITCTSVFHSVRKVIHVVKSPAVIKCEVFSK